MDVKGKTTVLTGDFKAYSRAEASAKLEALGAKLSGSVSTRTQIVFAGSAAGGKLDKARALGVPVFDEAALVAVLSGEPVAALKAGAVAAPPSASPAGAADFTSALPTDPEALGTTLSGADWSRFDPMRDLIPLRARLCAVEATHGVTDGHRAATARIRMLRTHLAHGQAQPGELTACAISPDRRHLATGSGCGDDYARGGVFQLWELATGRCVNTLDAIPGGVGGFGTEGCVQWTADGQRVGLAFNTNAVGGWDPFDKEAKAQSETYATGGMGRPTAWCWSPDGGRVFVSCQGAAEVPGVLVGLDAGPRDGRYRARHNPTPAPLANKLAKKIRAQLAGAELYERTWVRWTPDGERLFGYGHDQAYVTDAKGQVVWLVPVTSPVAWSADGRSLVDASAGLTFRDGVTGEVLKSHANYTKIEALHVGARGAVNRLAAVVTTPTKGDAAGVRVFDDGVFRYDVPTKLAPSSALSGDFQNWQWSSDGTQAVCLTERADIELWSLGDAPVKRLTVPAPEGTRGVLLGEGAVVAIGPRRLRVVRIPDGVVLGDHVFLRESEGLRPLEDEKGDLGDVIRPEPTFALGDGAKTSWITAFANGLIVGPTGFDAALDAALCWSVERRFAWPLRWGPIDLVPNAQAAATHPMAPAGVALKRLRTHASVRAGWDPPEGVGYDAVLSAALRSVNGLVWPLPHYAAAWVRGLALLHARRGEAAQALTTVDQIGEGTHCMAALATTVTLLGRAGGASAALDAATVLRQRAQWNKIDDVTSADLAASMACAHSTLGDAALGLAWMTRAEKVMAYAEPPWPQRLAVCRALLESGRDDEARQWWAARHWGSEAPDEEIAGSMVLELIRTKRSALAREFLALWITAHGALPEGLSKALVPWLVEGGLHAELDEFAKALGLKVTAAQRTRAKKVAEAPGPAASTARDRKALIEAHAESMKLPRAKRVEVHRQMALDAAKRRHFGAMLELIDALPHRTDSLDPRVSTMFHALWIATSGFDVAP